MPYDSTDWLNEYDTVFSIGGDLYTLTSIGGCNISLPLFLEKCQAKVLSMYCGGFGWKI